MCEESEMNTMALTAKQVERINFNMERHLNSAELLDMRKRALSAQAYEEFREEMWRKNYVRA
jgi:hypothetical protein